MGTSSLHTLEEILTQGIHLDDNQKPIKVSCIFVPKIQRAYAQGRANEKDVRSDFLKEIFATLTSDSSVPLELGFLFGSEQPLVNGCGSGFELLDGQQRTTTLFLLYWYIYCRESNEIPDFLHRFTYETRDTSTQFLVKITSKKYDFNISETKPSSILRKNKWFTDDFNCDATVCAMLNMLDDIHVAYNNTNRTDLLPHLSKLKFYVHILEHFEMNDELYLKMNSRGLSLTPFENFKASLVKYMKSPGREGRYGSDGSVGGKAPYWLEFTSNIDAKWIDIFWQKSLIPDGHEDVTTLIPIDDRTIGNSYLRFFNRYFFTKTAILKGLENKKLTPLSMFFYSEAESDEMEKRLIGWDKYEEVFELLSQEQELETYPVFGNIERILNVFHSNYGMICQAINADPYGGARGFDVRNKKNYTLAHRVAFCAVTEFIEALPSGIDFTDIAVQINFKRMLRVVHNIIENTPIESPVAIIPVLKAVSEIIRFPGATSGNFYQSLAQNNLSSGNRQLIEEKEKAQEMFDLAFQYDDLWEGVFCEAERHPFFKGSIAFFFSPKSGSSKDFSNRYNIIKDLFDSNGISKPYRAAKKHILIRAIMSCLNHWDSAGMQDRYFTENAEKEKYLKNIITGNKDVRVMFCNYFNFNTNKGIDEYLNDVIQKAAFLPGETNQSFKMLYNRLIKDDNATAIFDWVEKCEKEKNACYRIQDNRSYVILIPGKWYNQLVLDTERNLIIPSLVNAGFSFSDTKQGDCMNGPMGDSWGWQIAIEKSLNTKNGPVRLQLVFTEYKWVDYYVYGNDIKSLISAFNVDSTHIVDSGVKVAWLQYCLEKDKQPIIDKITDIEQIVAQL